MDHGLEHVDEESSGSKDSHEVEDLDPHEKARKGLNAISQLHSIVNLILRAITLQKDHVDNQARWDDVNIIPEFCHVLAQLVTICLIDLQT